MVKYGCSIRILRGWVSEKHLFFFFSEWLFTPSVRYRLTCSFDHLLGLLPTETPPRLDNPGFPFTWLLFIVKYLPQWLLNQSLDFSWLTTVTDFIYYFSYFIATYSLAQLCNATLCLLFCFIQFSSITLESSHLFSRNINVYIYLPCIIVTDMHQIFLCP